MGAGEGELEGSGGGDHGGVVGAEADFGEGDGQADGAGALGEELAQPAVAGDAADDEDGIAAELVGGLEDALGEG